MNAAELVEALRRGDPGAVSEYMNAMSPAERAMLTTPKASHSALPEDMGPVEAFADWVQDPTRPERDLMFGAAGDVARGWTRDEPAPYTDLVLAGMDLVPGIDDAAVKGTAAGLGALGLGMTKAKGSSLADILRAGDRTEEVAEAGRKPVAEMTPEELTDYGQQYGVDLGLTPVEEVADPLTGKTFEIPGGLDPEKPLTMTDAMWLKSQAYNPNDMSPEIQTQLQKKMLAATTPENIDEPTEMFNRIMFGMQSPNTPLLTNQFMTTRMRARTPEDIDAMANLIDWAPGEKVDKARRMAADKEIGKLFGIQGAQDGGMGMRSSVDLTNIGEFAKLYRDNPEFFQRQPDEPWSNFAERLIAVQRGLSPKTASFGAVWQDPGMADISAMDRHMARNFRPVLMDDPELGPQIRKQRVELWNTQIDRAREMDLKDKRAGLTNREKAIRKTLPPAGAKKARNYDRLIEQPGADAWDADQIITDSTKHTEPKFRLASGEINPVIPEYLRNLPIEPEKVTMFGPIYRRMLEENKRLAEERGLETFGEQWRVWDRIREQIEPHESMHKDVGKLPRMPAEELEKAFKHQKKAGFHTSGRKSTGERYVSPFDYQKGLYWGLTGAAALPTIEALRRSQENDDTI